MVGWPMTTKMGDRDPGWPCPDLHHTAEKSQEARALCSQSWPPDFYQIETKGYVPAITLQRTPFRQVLLALKYAR